MGQSFGLGGVGMELGKVGQEKIKIGGHGRFPRPSLGFTGLHGKRVVIGH